MGSVTVFTAARMQTIEDTTVVSGLVDVNGDLILYQRDGTPFNAGLVRGQDGEPGDPGAPGPTIPATLTTAGVSEYATDAEAIAGVLDNRTITPTALKAVFDSRNTASNVADLNALPSVAGQIEGARVHVDSLNVDFVLKDGAWAQNGVASVATTGDRDTEYAKASSAYLLTGTECSVTATPTLTYTYFTSASGVVTTSGWYPSRGALPYFRQTPSGTQNVGTSSWQLMNAIWGANEDLLEFTSFSAGLLTIKHTGMYIVQAQISMATGAGGTRATQVTRNSASIDTTDTIFATQATTNRGVGGSVAVRLVAGDVLRCFAFQTSGGTLAVQTLPGETYFMTSYLRPA